MAPSTRSSVTARNSVAHNAAATNIAPATTIPFFGSPSLRKSRRKTGATAAATLMTAAASAAVVALLPAVAGGSFSPIPPTPSSATTTTTTTRAAKRKTPSTANVTLSPKKKSASKKSNQQSKKMAPASKAKVRQSAPLTNSFEPMWSNRFQPENPVPIHTLILGTHPSIKSLAEQQYYGHSMNAFWWIAGDCLGFRRANGVGASGKPYQFTKDLRYKEDDIVPYDEQIKKLALSGFALWDVIGSCERPGSLDQDIRKDVPNPIRTFCDQHKGTIRRIVLANGGTGCSKFVKHFGDWLESGELMALPNHDASLKSFGRAIKRGETKREKSGEKATTGKEADKIVLISALSVSPAAAIYSYAEKRDFWDVHVYRPGLQDFQANQEQQRNKRTGVD